eukprot:CAMPEP_0201148880 /NCGR_PEP_ID=MMETSP0851-20130426/10277_1 /ASSEMBLY_ACC=CAM_ASM_000631 /TAXON_ID=183588 /ORGANISM="Pseudo-nitzschia fraudulenta, Strain WWA7" /LENGTH=314 /DNA_ID=CAMNT_0047425155 /DNA_START=72 /DNA_END=1016 /DNA_ORIENTATION=-
MAPPTDTTTTITTNSASVAPATRKQIKAILFDMDGTLLDTEALADKAILTAMFGGGDSLPESLRSKHPTSEWRLPWELKKRILGLRGKEWGPICLDFAREHVDDSDGELLPTVPELIDAWEFHLNGMCTEIEACEGAKELVCAVVALSSSSSSLSSTTTTTTTTPERTRIPMAIATSSRMSGVAKKRTRHESSFFEHIDAIVTGDDPAVANGKPAPDIYLEAARRLGVDPAECLVFEDALSGVRSGKAAGCTVVVVPDARFSEEEKEQQFRIDGGADVVLNSLWEFDGRPFGMDLNMNEQLLLLLRTKQREEQE